MGAAQCEGGYAHKKVNVCVFKSLRGIAGVLRIIVGNRCILPSVFGIVVIEVMIITIYTHIFDVAG